MVRYTPLQGAQGGTHRTCGGGLRLERRGLTAATALLGPAASSPSVAPASTGAARLARGVLTTATSLAAAAAIAVTVPVTTDVSSYPLLHRTPPSCVRRRPSARARGVRRPPPLPKSLARAGQRGLRTGEGRTERSSTGLMPCARAGRHARRTRQRRAQRNRVVGRYRASWRRVWLWASSPRWKMRRRRWRVAWTHAWASHSPRHLPLPLGCVCVFGSGPDCGGRHPGRAKQVRARQTRCARSTETAHVCGAVAWREMAQGRRPASASPRTEPSRPRSHAPMRRLVTLVTLAQLAAVHADPGASAVVPLRAVTRAFTQLWQKTVDEQQPRASITRIAAHLRPPPLPPPAAKTHTPLDWGFFGRQQRLSGVAERAVQRSPW